jgi:hypothetical protein
VTGGAVPVEVALAVGVGVLVGVGVRVSVGVGEAVGVSVGVGVGVGVPVGVGVGVAVSVGVGVAVGSDDGRTNFDTGVPSSAAFMKAVQMRAGNEPPVTEFMPPTPESDTGLPSAPSLTNITATARSGV